MLRHPVLPLVRLIQLLYLTRPFATIEEEPEHFPYLLERRLDLDLQRETTCPAYLATQKLLAV